MKEEIYLRPLKIEDAAVSWRWRNDPIIWRYTGSRPDKHISEDMERAWAAEAIKDMSRVNYAICLAETDLYIGNIYLTNIKSGCADLGIFIGDRRMWGKGYGWKALELLKGIASKELSISKILIDVDRSNISGIKTYEKCGAVISKMQMNNERRMQMIIDVN